MLKLYKSFQNSCNGLRLAWQEDHSFRTTAYQWGAGCILATWLVFSLDKSVFIWLLLIGSLFPMVIIETINSSIEAVTDKASPEHHPLAKKAKDIGSAAVLLTRILAAICWTVVLLEH